MHRTKNKHHKLILLIIVIILLVTFFINPQFYIKSIKEIDYSTILLVLAYLPGFFLLIGLIEVLLPDEFIVEHLGKHSGFMGSFYSFVFGSLMPGPLYLAFPLAGLLLRKGVTRFNIALFLSAWASLKISEEVFEIQFLGLRFMLLRILITIPCILLISYILDRIHFKEFVKKEV